MKEFFLRKSKYISVIASLVIGIVFFFFIGDRGVILERDSYYYISANLREVLRDGAMPLYPLFLKMITILPGTTIGMGLALYIQCAIAILSCIYITRIICNMFGLNDYEMLVIFILSLAPYGYTLPEYTLPHGLMTEAIAVPLFYVYAAHLLKGINLEYIRDVNISSILMVLLILARKQNVILIVFSAAAYLYILVANEKVTKKTIINLFVSIFSMIAVAIVVVVFSSSIRDRIVYSSLGFSLSGKAAYIMDESDKELYPEGMEREVVELIYQRMDQESMLLSYAGDGKELAWEHMINGLNYGTKNTLGIIRDYCYDNEISIDRAKVLAWSIIKTEFGHHPDRLIRVWSHLSLQAFISAIFIKKAQFYTLCAIVASTIYLLYLFSCAYTMRKHKKRQAYLALIVLLYIVINITFLNTIFFALQRYVVYAFGLFYIAFYIMLRSIWLRDRRIYVSFGENCLTDDILDRHCLKSYSTPYSSGRSNIEYILQLERENYRDFLNPEYLHYADVDGKRAVRNHKYKVFDNTYGESCMNGFEFTHHDVMSDPKATDALVRRVKRLESLKDKEVYIFYHHRMCESTDDNKLIEDLEELRDIYSDKCASAHIICFTQVLVNSKSDRRLEYSQTEGINMYYMHTTDEWAGNNQDIFWARVDEDLIQEMINDVVMRRVV